VLFGDAGGNLYVVSTASGQQLFTTNFSEDTIEAGITVAEGYIFVPTSAGVYAFSLG
jgi:outer membrane protein assembly factor BamB